MFTDFTYCGLHSLACRVDTLGAVTLFPSTLACFPFRVFVTTVQGKIWPSGKGAVEACNRTTWVRFLDSALLFLANVVVSGHRLMVLFLQNK